MKGGNMINLSKRARRLGYYSAFQIIRNLRDPDIFFATSINDFLQERHRVEIPWYKRGSFERIYVILHNVRIRKIEDNEKFFILEDDSGKFVTFWYNCDWFPTLHSYQEVVQANGLTEKDQLHEVFFRYLLRTDLSNICEVIPFKFTEITKESLSLFDRLGIRVAIKDLLPQTF